MGQGAVYKSVARNTAYIFLTKLFPVLSFFVVGVLFSRQLGKTDYGNYQQFWVAFYLLGTIAYAGIPVTLITYPAGFVKKLMIGLTRKRLLILGSWMILWCIVFGVREWQVLRLPFLLGFVMLVLYVIHSIQESLLIAAQRMRGLVVLNFIYAAWFLFIHLKALQGYSLELLLWYVCYGMIVRAAALFIVVMTAYQGVVPEAEGAHTTRKPRSLWLHLGMYDLLQTIFRFLDKFILSALLSAGLFAEYYNGAQEIPLLPYLLGAVSTSILVQLAANNKVAGGKAHEMSYQVGKVLACIVFPLFFFMFFFSRELFNVVFSEKYLASVPILQVCLLLLPLRAYNYTTVLQHLHQGALINKGALLDLVLALALIYPCYLLFGLPGIALSFVLSTYVQVGYYLFHMSRILNVPLSELLPLGDWLWKLLVSGLVIGFAHWLLSSEMKSLQMLFAGAATMLLTGGLMLLFEWRKARTGRNLVSNPPS